MDNRRFARWLVGGRIALLALIASAPPAQAGPSSFRYVDESFRLPADTNPPNTDTLDVDFVDVDGDGDLDLIVVNIGQDFVFINDGSGHFTDQTAARFPVTGDSTRKGVLADFNGDGTLDLFMANSRNQQNRLYFNNGQGVFTDVTEKNLPARMDTTTSVSVADLDDDGDLDLFLTNAGDFLAGHGFLGDQSLYLRNNGQGKLQDKTAVYFPEAIRPSTDAEFGDVDGDGDLDLVIGNSTDTGGAESLYIRYRNPGETQGKNGE